MSSVPSASSKQQRTVRRRKETEIIPATAMVVLCKHQPYMVLYGPFVLGTLFHSLIVGVMGGGG